MALFGPYVDFYIQSIKTICELAFLSLDTANEELLRYDNSEKEDINTNLIINHMQNIIMQAGNLSKFFWPANTKKVYQDRGTDLRAIFKIDDTSVLKNRNLRNSIEHYDERIDDYLAEDRSGYFFPNYVGDDPNDTEKLGHFFRAYFINTQKIIILNEEYYMPPLIDELNKCYKVTLE